MEYRCVFINASPKLFTKKGYLYQLNEERKLKGILNLITSYDIILLQGIDINTFKLHLDKLSHYKYVTQRVCYMNNVILYKDSIIIDEVDRTSCSISIKINSMTINNTRFKLGKARHAQLDEIKKKSNGKLVTLSNNANLDMESTGMNLCYKDHRIISNISLVSNVIDKSDLNYPVEFIFIS